MPPEKTVIYEFGDFSLDAYGRRLLRKDSPELVPLTGKVFDTLLYLVEHRGETLGKDELLQAIWPDLVVEENNLTQNISTLRQALGELRGENRFIATVPRKGYRFVAQVVEKNPGTPAVPAAQRTMAVATSQPAGKWRRWSWAGAALLIAALAAFLLLRTPLDVNPLRGAVGGTHDSDAFSLYSNGRYALARSDEASIRLAIEYFQQAIDRDPRFALAHAGLADCHLVLGVFGMRAPAETFPRARDSALRALQIEPGLAQAFAALGHIKMQYDRDWDGAAADFDRAVELNPNIPEPRMYRGVLWSMRGQLDRGLEEIREAQRLEPLLTLSKTRMGSMLYFARRYDEAERQLKESLALDDRPAIAHRTLGRVYLHTGRPALALAEFAKSAGTSPGSYADVANALAKSGRRAEAQAELDRVLAIAAQRYVSPVDLAAIYAGLGETDTSLLWLERALEQRASTLGFIAQNPAFDVLHRDPRFVDLVRRIGVWPGSLPPASLKD
ncbi:MAG TPA: winged helix-turn-helix domain-containing protein [Steroidobacteraceae bacterium]|nr:winged helix-turn-helix domain-containing protein [Steroidobacteraceae bacterium]